MTIKLSEYDRGLTKLAFAAVPWGGGEDAMLAKLKLSRTLRLAELDERGPDFPVDKLDQKAAGFSLARPQIELLVEILSGGGTAWKPDIGPLMAEVIEKVRSQCPKQK